MNKIVWIIVIAIVVIGGGWFYMNQNASPAMDNTPQTGTQVNTNTNGADYTPPQENTGTPTNSGNTGSQTTTQAPSAPTTKEFTVVGDNYSFAPNMLTVNKGDKVKITFQNKNGFHDFVIDELGVNSGKINGGQEKIVEFTADKAGSFEYYCSVGSHRAMGMKGTLTVK